ncbi:cation diffusion facilitator family transporter [Methanosalsum zhilinae DSM 4017]|uniref:Cation diffusion facilitator family transporter n=1 Tax=Methanosalsum zhilinae (strain DSM 4017 / NBRC 107636 / OCM 62 / WeN5) TaxID=679901 RepID=F7XNQ6_METZD|nr:cation diffusion facilitator family transporter [Methanosalsum zhilinae]AEH61257.1 cation diffusion facilitator family transporter [Methanosalsum zhilinae DSM 4017]
MKDRFDKIRRILLVILVLNLLVAIAKIVYGSFTDTLSIQADGYHSLSDGISNIVGLIGIKIASRPPDRDHPYGHKKYESLASIGIAMMLVFISFELLHRSYERFVTGDIPTVTTMSFIIMVAAMLISIIISIYEKREGEKLGSDILIADSMHTKSDVYSTLAVIMGLVAIRAGYPIVDPLIALIIAIVIFHAAISIVRQSSQPLCDASRMDNRSIACLVGLVDGVVDCHNIRTRGTSGDVHIDLHVTVSPDMRTDEAHRVADNVEKILIDSFEDVTDVVVHIEPASGRKKEQG